MLMHIISMNEHYDKRPMNALIAKAAELCEEKAISHLIYGQFIYGNKHRSSLLEFKRRNGFERINFPRYYIPLTLKGELFVRMRLYRGLSGLVPEPILEPRFSCRTWYYKTISTKLILNRKSCRCSSTLERLNRNQEMECSIPPAGSNIRRSKLDM